MAINFTPPTLRRSYRSRIMATIRRRTVLAETLSGTPRQEAGIKAGYSSQSAANQASMALSHPETIRDIRDVLTYHGLDDDSLAYKMSKLLDCEYPVYFSYKGKAGDTRMMPAFETQRKTLELALKLRGHLKDTKEHDIRIGIVSLVVDALRKAEQGEDSENGGH